ncbi:MAG: tetratricopeptide repeat protein [Chloroflexi bacterium]|nr:tetratricopeptide repeat protein [Chloroflexota bacterium]
MSANNLPLQLTSFIGREREIEEVKHLLTTSRLLTLTGAGGCGKTRLALQVAADAPGVYPDGIWLGELAALSDPALVPGAVASAVGIREIPGCTVTESLVGYLRTTMLLLVLDNCEHVVSAAAELVDALLHNCPGVRILATSREPLGSAGETTWRVPSLAVPPHSAVSELDLEHLTRYETVELFIDRALAALPGFVATSQNAAALAEICRRLDGIPLAIELAAARVRAFSVDQIAARLDDRFRLLTGGQRTAMPRQQTLRATVDWSYTLLSDPERALLRRLSVFAGGWTFEAAEAAEDAEPKLRGSEDRLFLVRLEEEHANMRLALEWGLTSSVQGDAALRLSGALTWFWWLHSYHDEGRRWLVRALAATPARSAARMKALHGAGWLAHHQRNLAVARELLGESLLIARELDDRWTIALVLHHLGRVAYFDNDPARTRSLGEDSLAAAEEVGDLWLIAWALHLLGLAAYIAADYPTARTYYSRSLEIRRELGYQEGIGILLMLLGVVAVRLGDLGRAYELYREGVVVAQDVHGPWGLRMPLAGFAHIAALQGEPRRAVRLGGAAATQTESSSTPLIPLFEALLAEGLEMARRALGEEAYAAAWAEGRLLSVEDAVAEALSIEVAPTPELPAVPAATGDGPFAELTAAEVQILRLLAAGRTTREIAAELVVAVSTVDRHITHVYEKLGVRNRAAATAFALKNGLV